MNDRVHSNLVSYEIVERMGLFALEKQRLQVYRISFSQQSKGRHLKEIRLPLMAPESMEGRGREPDVKLIIIRVILSTAGTSCPGRER